MHHLHHLLPGGEEDEGDTHRQGARQRASLRGRSPGTSSARRRSWRTLGSRTAGEPWLSQPSREDGRSVYRQSVHHRGEICPCLSHRRHRALSARRQHPVCGSSRRTGQDSWFPHRTQGGRKRHSRIPGHQGCHRTGLRRGRWRQVHRCLHRQPRHHRHRSPQPVHPRPEAALHGACCDDADRCHPAQSEPEGQQACPAQTRTQGLEPFKPLKLLEPPHERARRGTARNAGRHREQPRLQCRHPIGLHRSDFHLVHQAGCAGQQALWRRPRFPFARQDRHIAKHRERDPQGLDAGRSSNPSTLSNPSNFSNPSAPSSLIRSSFLRPDRRLFRVPQEPCLHHLQHPLPAHLSCRYRCR